MRVGTVDLATDYARKTLHKAAYLQGMLLAMIELEKNEEQKKVLTKILRQVEKIGELNLNTVKILLTGRPE